MPEWLAAFAERPLVYLNLGKVFNDLSLFRVLLAGLAELRCNTVATVGDENHPAELEPLPPNVRVERFVPQGLLLSRCSAVVSHGGSGSMLGTLAHGLPTLLVPRSRPVRERRGLRGGGAASVLLPAEVRADAVRDAVAAVLEEPSYPAQPRRLAAEIAAMPAPDDLVPVLLASCT